MSADNLNNACAPKKVRLVVVPTPATPILPAAGFQKKCLAHDHLELGQKCGFSCSFCSTNSGYQSRVRGAEYNRAVAEQLGVRVAKAAAEPRLALYDPTVLEKLGAQLAGKPATFGAGRTLMLSMLVDPYGPAAIKFVDEATRMVIERTSYRVRVLTKSKAVASMARRRYFVAHRQRFAVGLSIGSLDDVTTRKIELDTSPSSARVAALHRLQDDGITTFAMLCPVMPSVLIGNHLEDLANAMRPDRVEDFWCEPFNDRQNWQQVRAAYREGSAEYDRFTAIFAANDRAPWSAYATELYVRLARKARAEGWIEKLKFLLYEAGITPEDAQAFAGLNGVLLQSPRGDDGFSKHPSFAAFERERLKARR